MNILVTYRQNNGPGQGWETGAALCRALRRLGHRAHPYGTTYKTGQQIAPEPAWTPDLIVFMECGDGDPQYLGLRQKWPGVPLFMWLFDTAINLEQHRHLVHELHPDHLFLANPDMLHHFAGSKYLPYAADETRFKPTTGPKSGAAIIGTPFPERVEFARRVGVDVIQTQTGQEYADAVARLRVHVHHTNSGGDGLLVMRYWETLCCGTVLFAPKSTEFERLGFESPTHYVSYDEHFTAPGHTAKDRLDSVMANAEHLRIIAANGRAHVLAHHTYRHRAQEILEAM